MSNFFLVTKVEFCDTLDRVQEQKLTVTIPVRWTPVLDIIEDDEEELDINSIKKNKNAISVNVKKTY